MSSRKSRPNNAKPKKEKIEKTPFVAWFQKKVAEQKLKYWQEKEVLVFFKEKKLGNEEPREKYDEMLKKY